MRTGVGFLRKRELPNLDQSTLTIYLRKERNASKSSTLPIAICGSHLLFRGSENLFEPRLSDGCSNECNVSLESECPRDLGVRSRRGRRGASCHRARGDHRTRCLTGLGRLDRLSGRRCRTTCSSGGGAARGHVVVP